MKKKKSRLTKTDVNAICEMQRKIDAYENYIAGICGLVQSKYNPNKIFVITLSETPLDELVNTAWIQIQEMKEELDRLKNNQ